MAVSGTQTGVSAQQKSGFGAPATLLRSSRKARESPLIKPHILTKNNTPGDRISRFYPLDNMTNIPGDTISRYTDEMELCHALNRGVEKRKIFMDPGDRMRFVHDLYEFNDTAPAPEFTKYREIVSPDIIRKERERIVDIHGWCLMGNHYHLLLSERIEGGLSLFLRKLNVGYAMYFNEKYKRSGTLFEGRTKKIRITSDPHFLHILHYIHLNPLDFLEGAKDWRALAIKSTADALVHLNAYRWSSYLDYCGKKNFPSVISKELFGDVFKNYPKTITAYLKDIDIELTDIRPWILE
jgi:putative transposase